MVGLRRDGGKRFWCLEHKGDATAKYGRRGKSCRYAHVLPLSRDEKLTIDPAVYRGGIAIWGAVPPIYDTTPLPLERGVHVHARKHPRGKKVIDHTYRAVQVVVSSGETLEISELDAIYFMVSSVFGYVMKFVECTFCNYPHLDKDWFSVHNHRRHLCAGCGHLFKDDVSGIGNPAMKIRASFSNNHKVKVARRKKRLRQRDYPGGIQIWGSNPALLWTASRSEEAGIHIHAFGRTKKDNIDDTFSSVTIDGITLDPHLVRVRMAQSGLPHIAGRVVNIYCEQCGEPHFDDVDNAFTPHDDHYCHLCGSKLRSKGRFRKTIGNPLCDTLDQLAKFAVRQPQKHDSYLFTETL